MDNNEHDNNNKRSKRTRKTSFKNSKKNNQFNFQDNNYNLAKRLSEERANNAKFRTLDTNYKLLRHKYNCQIAQTQDMLKMINDRVQLGIKQFVNGLDVLLKTVELIDEQKAQIDSMVQVEGIEQFPGVSKTLKVHPMVHGHTLKRASILLQRIGMNQPDPLDIIPEEFINSSSNSSGGAEHQSLNGIHEAVEANNFIPNDSPVANNTLANDGLEEHLGVENSSFNTSVNDVSIVRRAGTNLTVSIERLRDLPIVRTMDLPSTRLQQNGSLVKESRWNQNSNTSLVNFNQTKIPFVHLEKYCSKDVHTCSVTKQNPKNKNNRNSLSSAAHEIDKSLCPVVSLKDISKATVTSSVGSPNWNSDHISTDGIQRTPLVSLENCERSLSESLSISTPRKRRNSGRRTRFPSDIQSPVVALEDISKTRVSSALLGSQKERKKLPQSPKKPSSNSVCMVSSPDDLRSNESEQRKEPVLSLKTSAIENQSQQFSLVSGFNEQMSEKLQLSDDQQTPEKSLLSISYTNVKSPIANELPSKILKQTTSELPDSLMQDPLEGPSWKYANGPVIRSKRKTSKKVPKFWHEENFLYSSSSDEDNSIWEPHSKKKDGRHC